MEKQGWRRVQALSVILASWSYGRIFAGSGKPAGRRLASVFLQILRVWGLEPMIRFYIVVCALLLDLLFHAYCLQPFSLFSVGLSPQYKHEFYSMVINCRTAQGNVVGPFKFTKTHWHYYCTGLYMGHGVDDLVQTG